MDYKTIICYMRRAGVEFAPGLSEDEILQIETTYGVRFPASLREFYQTALPVFCAHNVFPRWNDFSAKNIAAIRERMAAPYQWLRRDVERGFCPPAWEGKDIDRLFGEAPKLIPVYAHRYMPAIDHPDPPVISTVGRDTIVYGRNLRDYLERDFTQNDPVADRKDIPFVPVWSDVIAVVESFFGGNHEF